MGIDIKYVFVLSFLFLFGCGIESLDIAREDTALAKFRLLSDIEYEVRYLPIEHQALRQLKSPFDSTNYEEAIEPFLDHHYLRLTIRDKSGKRADNLTEKELNKIRFHIKDRFKLSLGGNQIPAVLYHFEPAVIKSAGMNFTIVFSEKGNAPGRLFTDDLTFYFIDEFFNKQNIIFNFKKEDLNEIPSLKPVEL